MQDRKYPFPAGARHKKYLEKADVLFGSDIGIEYHKIPWVDARNVRRGKFARFTNDGLEGVDAPEVIKSLGGGVSGGFLTVAAANTPDVLRSRADYQCDGSADEEEIQDALNALIDDDGNDVGGEVRLLDGTFNFTDSVTLDDYQTLRGNGQNTVLTTASAITFIANTGSDGSEATGIIISDLKISGASTGEYGISMAYANYSYVLNTYITEVTESGIYAASEYSVFSGNTVSSCSNCGLHLDECKDCRITGNLFSTNKYGIYLDECFDCVVSGNNCQGNTYYGIWIGQTGD